jgi:hypothetical protein
MRKSGLNARILALVIVGWLGSLAGAAEAPRNEVVAATQEDGSRARLKTMLERPEVVAELARIGVPVADANERLAGMADGDVALLVERIDGRPARAADVLGALLLLSIVLLMTDAFGFTKVSWPRTS